LIRFQRILVPLSATDADAPLVRYAAMTARLGVTREMHFLHVISPVRFQAMGARPSHWIAQMEARIQADFGAPVEGLSVHCHIAQGTRIDRLLEFVIKHKTDVILLGMSAPRRGARSLAQRLTKTAPCTVWGVPDGFHASMDRILAPIDLSELSADSLSLATTLGRLRGVDVCDALHVSVDACIAPGESPATAVRRLSPQFDRFIDGVNTHGVAIDPFFVECDEPAAAILAHARRVRSDLIVMSKQSFAGAASPLQGSVAARAMGCATAPVLAVQRLGGEAGLVDLLQLHRHWAEPDLKAN